MRYKPFIAAAVAVAAVSAGSASASPVADGCPAAFTGHSIEYFEALGPYRLPQLVDGAGNGDDYVCAFPLPDAVRDASCSGGDEVACELQRLGLPVYRFVDDVVPVR